MNKNHFFARRGTGSLAMAALATLFLSSCAIDGFDDDEKFDIGVTGQQLVSPELSDSCFSTRVGADGSEKVLVSWKVVYGAGGYECKVYNVNDPSNPLVVANDTVDGASFSFDKAEDTDYQVCVRTLGNAAKQNLDAADATQHAYSTMIPAQLVPSGVDIAEYISAHFKNTNDEQAFELAAGGSYTLKSPLDFGMHKISLRGNRLSRPVVTYGEGGVLETSAQLKVKFINFDCTNASNKEAVITMSENPSSEAAATVKGVNAAKNKDAAGNPQPANVYVVTDPIIIQECAFKNVPCEFFCVGQHPWGISDFRINNCVIQMNATGEKYSNGSFISAYSHAYAGPDGKDFYFGNIKNITISNSTIYNIVDNSKNYFVRFNNKDIDRVFSEAAGTFNMNNTTLCRVFSNKNFADRTPTVKTYVISFKNNVMVDEFRIQKLIQGGCTTDAVAKSTNTIWGINTTIDGTDKDKWATEENPGFTIDELNKPLDFTQANFGLNLKPTGAISSTVGDPRWLK